MPDDLIPANTLCRFAEVLTATALYSQNPALDIP